MARTTINGDYEIPRKAAVLFLLIGTAKSMAGTRIGALNSAIEELLVIIKEMNDTSADAIVEIAILTFDTTVQWLTPSGPINPEHFYFNHLDAGGATAMGEAFRSLESKLHRGSGFMQRAWRAYAPVILLISDSEPTDAWESNLALLKQNKLFKASAKIALAIGDDANSYVLEQFTGSKEAVVRVSDGNVAPKLAKMLTFIAIDEDDWDYEDVYLKPCSYCGRTYGSNVVHMCLEYEIHTTIPDSNTLWQALKRVHDEGGEDMFSSVGMFRSALADFLNGIGQDIIRLRKRTVEAVELGVYKRLKEAEKSDLERVVRVETKRLQEEGINEKTAQEIVYALAKFFVRNNQVQLNNVLQAAIGDDDWDMADADDDIW